MTQRLSHLRGSDRVRRINDHNVKGIAHLFLQHVPNEEEEEMGMGREGREEDVRKMWGGDGEDARRMWGEYEEDARRMWGECGEDARRM